MGKVRDERGATMVIAAIALPVLILMTAFAVDLGRQRSSRRTMQARADIVALDMVRLADGRTEDQITGLDASGGSTPALYEAYIVDSANRNEVARSALVAIEWGTWNGTTFTPTLGNAVPDAVEVTASEVTDYFFQPGSGSATRTAVATRDDLAHLSLGSTLLQANLGNSTLLNALLTGLVCGSPAIPPPVSACPNQADIGAAGYEGLATHDVTLDDLQSAGGFGSPEELLEEELTASEFASLVAQAFRNNGDPSTANLYDCDVNDPSCDPDQSLAGLSNDMSGTFTIGDVVSVESPGGGSVADTEVSPFPTWVSGVEVANGDNFIDLSNAIGPVSLPAGISNLTLLSHYQLVETPVSGIGRVGSASTMPPFLRTAQIRLVQSLAFDLNVSVSGTGVTGRVTLPVDVSGGGAEGTLTAINCTQPDTDSTIDVTVAPRPIVGTAGRFWTAASPATIGNVSLRVLGIPAGTVGLSAYGAVDPALQNGSAAALPDIMIDETRSSAGSGFSLGGSLTNVKLQTTLGGVSALNATLATTLNSLLAAVSNASAPALNGLGVSVSSSDVHNIDTTCRAVRLAD
jgi:uncharacterized membrane protein